VTAVSAAGRHEKPQLAARKPAELAHYIRYASYIALLIQLLGFMCWSAFEYHRYALTFDFGQYQQAWYLIAHGVLNPYNSLAQVPFWQNHTELIMWPAALLYWLWPHQVTLLWIQDIGVVMAEFLALRWICDLAHGHSGTPNRPWLAAAGLILLIANPWIWWSIAFDFHTESLAAPFAVLLARDLVDQRKRAWLWIAPLLTCGDVAATYVFGLGAGTAIAGRGSRRVGLGVAAIGLATTGVISLVHGNLGSANGLLAYAYLATTGPVASLTLPALVKGIIAHPQRAIAAIWSKRVNLWANIAPAGIVGLGYTSLLPLFGLVLVENSLFPGLLFSMPSFQALTIYVLLPVGTVGVLTKVLRRRRWLAIVIMTVVLASAIGWLAAWAPQFATKWLRVSSGAAAALATINSGIPASAEVIASSGIVGRFSSRKNVRALVLPGSIAVSGPTWFVVTPAEGPETQSTTSAMALIGELAGPLHATLIAHSTGVWAFRWSPPPGVRSVLIPAGANELPVWTGAGAAGRSVMEGTEARWHVTATGASGYVSSGLAWQVPAGQYVASVRLSASGLVNVEVWNDTGNTLIARRAIPATKGIESVEIRVPALKSYSDDLYAGWGPFRANFVPPPPGQRLEIRVWSPGHETVNIYNASLARAGN
jgi:uncharacterized membrane protein